MGNRIIFDDASCHDCERMINRFEQPAMKIIFGAPRAKLGVPRKKRKGETPLTHLPVPVLDKRPDDGGKIIETAMIEVAKHPLRFSGLLMHEPTLLVPPKPGVPHYDLYMQQDTKSELDDRYPGKTFRVGSIDFVLFAQLLAKIAYGLVVAHYGYGSFLSLVHPLLEGKTKEFSDVIGGDREIPAPLDAVYEFGVFEFRSSLVTYVGANVRIWPHVGTPNYKVVVGVLPDHLCKSTEHGPYVKIPH